MTYILIKNYRCYYGGEIYTPDRAPYMQAKKLSQAIEKAKKHPGSVAYDVYQKVPPGDLQRSMWSYGTWGHDLREQESELERERAEVAKQREEAERKDAACARELARLCAATKQRDEAFEFYQRELGELLKDLKDKGEGNV